ncbi:E3 ubiquitin-protein ligase TRIM71-like, partial [Halyomorpha halys]
VTSECDGLQYQVEVRNISQRICSLSQKLESVSVLSEPRENSFIECNLVQGCLTNLEQGLKATVRTTTTFPSFSTLSSLGEHVVNLECTVVLTTIDYDGNVRLTGGDPVVGEILSPSGETLEILVDDRGDGTYHLKFRPPVPGRYEMKVNVVDRPVKQCPYILEVSEHNNPIATYGSRGSGKDQLLQPVAITYDPSTEQVYVVDTGNSRIKVLSKDLSLIKHLDNPGLQGRSCTGISCFTSAASDP